jgi:3-hydroxyisobutyrate dehydrogenase-like beta-hydroxyacid dehydrogenase
MRLAFVGAGQMGMPMVRRLVTAGHEVVVHARRPEARAEAEVAGAASTADASAAVSGADAVVVCVFSDVQLRDAALGPDGFLPSMEEGALLVTHTTGSPATSRLLAERGAGRGIRVVEAPVSGSADDITAGRVTVMLGGAPGDVDAVRPIVAAYGDPVLHLGPLGAAQAVKLLNNALFAANLQLIAEVERLAGELGIDWAQAAAAFQSSSGASRAMGIVASMGTVQALVEAGSHFLVKDVTEVVATAADLGLDLGQLEAINRDGPLPFLVADRESGADHDPSGRPSG